MSQGTRGGEVGMMVCEWLRRGGMRVAKGLDELNYGEVTDGLNRESSRYLDRDGNIVVMDDGLELVRVSGQTVTLLLT